MSLKPSEKTYIATLLFLAFLGAGTLGHLALKGVIYLEETYGCEGVE